MKPPSTKLDNSCKYVKTLHQHILAHIAPYRAFLLAFSGGLDSTVLLDALTELKNKDTILDEKNIETLRAVYIHHGLSLQAEKWSAHCAYQCLRRNVAFSSVRVDLNKKSEEGTEAAARSARYLALAGILKNNEVLLTAQHQDDQAETVLLALKRGSGPTGLSGMSADMLFFQNRLLRPLLDCKRKDLEVYARTRRITWIEDHSNTDLRFDRNFLRLKILPTLRKRWPQFSNTVARSAQLCAEQELLLDELLKETLNALIQPDGSLHLTTLITMSEAHRSALLRRWLASCSVRMPSRQQLAYLWQDVALSRRDAVAKLQLDDRQIRRFHDRLYVLPNLPTFYNSAFLLPWPPDIARLKLPNGLGTVIRYKISNNKEEQEESRISGDANNVAEFMYKGDTTRSGNNPISFNSDNALLIPKTTVVRTPLPCEKVSVRFGAVRGLLHITGRKRGRTLKKIWQERNVPPWWRTTTPLLFYNEKLIAALGVFVTLEGEPQEFEAQWQLLWHSKIRGGRQIL